MSSFQFNITLKVITSITDVNDISNVMSYIASFFLPIKVEKMTLKTFTNLILPEILKYVNSSKLHVSQRENLNYEVLRKQKILFLCLN